MKVIYIMPATGITNGIQSKVTLKEINMQFRVDYKYKDNNNAYNRHWKHNFEIILAESEKQAEEKFKKIWTADKELVIKTVEKV